MLALLCFPVVRNRCEEEQWELGFPLWQLQLSFISLVCPWLIGLKNEEVVYVEGRREQELRIPVTAGTGDVFFLFLLFESFVWQVVAHCRSCQ